MTSKAGNTALIQASAEGHIDSLLLLLQFDPSVDHVRMANKEGNNGLILASRGGHTDVVRALLAKVRLRRPFLRPAPAPICCLLPIHTMT